MTETTWSYVVQDFSPLLRYFGVGGSNATYGSNLDPAWKQSCPIAPSTRLGTLTVCDLASTHTTNAPGAGLSLSFYGQAVQLFGNVTAEMEYIVALDGHISQGRPVDQTLATFAGLTQGNHVVSIIADPPSAGSDAALLFDNAVVTVGTGLTGATVTRSVVQDNDTSLSYTPSTWQREWFEDWELPHATQNATWHQLSAGTPGSVSLSFTAADAVIAHGLSWSFFPSTYRITLDNQEYTLFGNSSLPDLNPSGMYLDGIIAFEPNPSGTLRSVSIDNADGVGYLGIDYFEIITVTGGTPINNTVTAHPPWPTTTSSPHVAAAHSVPIAVFIGPIVGGIVLLTFLGIMLYRWIRRRRREPDFEELGVRWFNPDAMVRQSPDNHVT